MATSNNINYLKQNSTPEERGAILASYFLKKLAEIDPELPNKVSDYVTYVWTYTRQHVRNPEGGFNKPNQEEKNRASRDLIFSTCQIHNPNIPLYMPSKPVLDQLVAWAGLEWEDMHEQLEQAKPVHTKAIEIAANTTTTKEELIEVITFFNQAKIRLDKILVSMG